MSWLTLSLLSLTCFVIYDLASRYIATRTESPRAFATIYNAIIATMSPLIFLIDRTLPGKLTPSAIFLTIIGLILWGLNGRLEYFVKKNVEASTFSIVSKIAPVGTFLLALVFLHESLTLSKGVGVALIIFANLLIFAGKQRSHIISTKGLQYTLTICTILAFAWFLDAINVKNWGVATFSILSFAVGSVISGIFPLIKLAEIKKEITLTPIWKIALLGFFNLAGYAFMLKALTIGEASSVMPIATSASPFIVILGYLFLGEKDYLLRKLAAALVTVFAIYLMR